MPVLPRPSSPRAALADLWAFIRNGNRDRLLGATLAVLITIIILIIFVVDAKVNTAPPPQVIYTKSWSVDRTDAQIIADQKKDQAALDAARKAKQAQFKELQDKLGIE